MLNKKGERELAYVVKVDSIQPIDGADKVELAIVGGWTIMVRKGQFKEGDLAVYFEIDSKVPEKEVFEFLASKHYKVKTQKYFKGTVISQGLLMSFSDFGWDNNKYKLGDFLTKELGVTYADPEDNKRKSKSNPDAKYQSMMSRHPRLAKSKFGKWAMKHMWAKKLLFLFFGRRNDKPNGFPNWVVKTDEERIQNLTNRIPEFVQETWISTEKVDGTSTTFTMKRDKKKFDYKVCSRNVCFDTPEKEEKCYYDSNVYLEMSEKYDMRDVLKQMLDEDSSLMFVTIQGETYGGNIQKRDYSTKEHDLAVFNVIYGLSDGTTKRLNPVKMKEVMDKYGVPTVPIICTEVTLPNTCAEILEMAGGKSAIDGKPREGLVFRSLDGRLSFKAVDNEFLLKFH